MLKLVPQPRIVFSTTRVGGDIDRSINDFSSACAARASLVFY